MHSWSFIIRYYFPWIGKIHSTPAHTLKKDEEKETTQQSILTMQLVAFFFLFFYWFPVGITIFIFMSQMYNTFEVLEKRGEKLVEIDKPAFFFGFA